ncbi:MAG: hypothetical protein NZL94_08035 [Meiothermus sp.]|uniref:Vgb family protein n=1 Tax=Meiothermus sp. TaxID=1955249 RepID=UPI00260468F4|nr:two-component regulator propeller domain-containing protein [Meiothermus sp.]MCS7058810.1 hypothetical protein [Meiothermus sp.]
MKTRGLLLLLPVALGMAFGQAGQDCPRVGQGELRVEVAGLPPGLPARLRVSGPGGYSQTLTGSQSLRVAAGPYALQAETLADSHPIVRQAYRGGQSRICVRANRTTSARIEYRLIPTSGRVWFGEQLRHRVYGFPRSQLGAAGMLRPSPDANTQAFAALAFDREGNLWIARRFGSEPHLYRYAATSLGRENPTPDRRINLRGLSQNHRVNALAFDREGNLWIAAYTADSVFRLSAAQLESAGSGPTALAPQVTLSVAGPSSLAFDREGNLWVGRGEAGSLAEPEVLRYNRARLGRSIPAGQGPDRNLTTLHWNRINRLGNSSLAFDREGNLWVMSLVSGTLHRLPKEVLSGTGSQTFDNPDADGILRIFLGNGRLYGMAFDEGGGLWVTYGSDRLAWLSPAQLTASTAASDPLTPERVFTLSSALPHSPALFPAPAGLPLFHSLP